MSNRYPIKWTEADLKEVQRTLKNFNAKLSRLEKKDPKNAGKLPKFSKEVFDEEQGEKVVVFTDRLSIDQFKELIYSRQDLNREINALKRFSRRGAEKLVTIDNTDNNIQITKWQKEEMNRRLAFINKRRDKRREDIGNIIIKDKGQELGYRYAEMGNQALKQLEPIKLSYPSMSMKDMKWKMRTVFKESKSNYFDEKDMILKENYIKSLEENFNPHDIKEVIKKIRKMDNKDFLAEFYAQGGNFELSYPGDEDDQEAYLNELKSIWKIE